MVHKNSAIFYSESKISGRGVFCAVDIKKGDLLEVCPVLRIKKGDMSKLKKTKLYNYFFDWGESGNEGALALGYGSLYNHSSNPNAKYLADYAEDELIFIAVKKIPKGKEITVNYNGAVNDKSKVWFES